MGIPVIHDSPGVGQNLQSQVGTGDVIFTLKSPVSYYPLRVALNPANLINYVINKDGPFSGVSGFDGLGNIRVNDWSNASSSSHDSHSYHSENNTSDPNWPDVQIIMLALHAGTKSFIAKCEHNHRYF